MKAAVCHKILFSICKMRECIICNWLFIISCSINGGIGTKNLIKSFAAKFGCALPLSYFVISDFENGNVDTNSPIVLLEILNEEIYLGLKKYFEENNIHYIDAKVGCTVGIHSGTRACGIFFIEK